MGLIVLALAGAAHSATPADAAGSLGRWQPVATAWPSSGRGVSPAGSVVLDDGRSWVAEQGESCFDLCEFGDRVWALDQGQWVPQTLPPDGRLESRVTALATDGAGEVWLASWDWNQQDDGNGDPVVSDQLQQVYRWDGEGFAAMPPAPFQLTSLAPLSPDHAWGCGVDGVAELVGGSWVVHPVPDGFGCDRVAVAGGSVWVAGRVGQGLDARPAVLRWQDGGWSDVSPDVGPGYVGAAAAMRDGRLAALIWLDGGIRPRIEVFDGARWTQLPAVPVSRPAPSMAASSSSDIWLGDAGTVRHWDGRAWETLTAPQALIPQVGETAGNLIWAGLRAVQPIDSSAAGSVAPFDRGDEAWFRAGAETVRVDDRSGAVRFRMAPDAVVSHVLGFAGTFDLRGIGTRLRVPVSPGLFPAVVDLGGHATLRVGPDTARRMLADVQVKRPDTGRFVWLRRGVAATSIRVHADAGPGAYTFRVRVHRPGGPPSGWSPPVAR